MLPIEYKIQKATQKVKRLEKLLSDRIAHNQKYKSYGWQLSEEPMHVLNRWIYDTQQKIDTLTNELKGKA